MSGLKAEEIASRMDLCGNTVRYWINRFNARGLDGLEECVFRRKRPGVSVQTAHRFGDFAHPPHGAGGRAGS
jgi:transposase